MKIEEFYERLDSLLATGQLERIEILLTESIGEAKEDKAILAVLLKEAAAYYQNMGSFLAEADNFRDSSAYLLKGMALLEGYEGMEAEKAAALTSLAVNYLRLNQVDEGEACFRHAIGLYEGMPEERNSNYGTALAGLAEVYYVRRAYLDAILTYKQALDEIRRCHGESLAYAAALENCAHICEAAGYLEEAEPLLAHAERIRKG